MRRVGAVTGNLLKVLLLFGVAASASSAVDPGKAAAPRMEFAPPPPGSYTLQKIQRVSEAVLLDSADHAVKLSAADARQDHSADFLLHVLRRSPGLPFRAYDPGQLA